MNKVLIALLSAFTVLAASAATPSAPAAVKPTTDMAAPAAKPTAAHKAAHAKKVKHVAKKKVMKQKAADQVDPKA